MSYPLNIPLNAYNWLLSTDPKDSSEWLQIAESLRVLAYESSYPLITRKMFEKIERKAADAGVVIPKT